MIPSCMPMIVTGESADRPAAGARYFLSTTGSPLYFSHNPPSSYRAQIGACRAASNSLLLPPGSASNSPLNSRIDISENAPTTDRILGCLRAFTTRFTISTIPYHPHRIDALSYRSYGLNTVLLRPRAEPTNQSNIRIIQGSMSVHNNDPSIREQ
jgi:hypothetical protein